MPANACSIMAHYIMMSIPLSYARQPLLAGLGCSEHLCRDQSAANKSDSMPDVVVPPNGAREMNRRNCGNSCRCTLLAFATLQRLPKMMQQHTLCQHRSVRTLLSYTTRPTRPASQRTGSCLPRSRTCSSSDKLYVRDQARSCSVQQCRASRDVALSSGVPAGTDVQLDKSLG